MIEQTQDQLVDAAGDGLSEACGNGNVQLPSERPRVTYRPLTDEDRAKAAADVERWEREGLLVPADGSQLIAGRHLVSVLETSPLALLRPVNRLREDEDAMMQEFHRIVTENPHLWWDADWVRRVYERYAREQELEEMVRSEEEARSEAGYRDFIEAGYLAEENVDRWLDEYERLGFLNPRRMLPDGGWEDDIATG